MSAPPADARLRAAMLEAVGEHGYTATTISEVVSHASVSKSTFYQHYASKEECFLATLSEIVDVVSGRTSAAYRAHVAQGLIEGLRASSAEFARLVRTQPQAARLVLIDSLNLGATSVPYLERASRHFEDMFRHSFEQDPSRGEVSDLEIRAIVGGMRRLVHRRIREGRTANLQPDLEVLLDWALSYQRPRRTDPRRTCDSAEVAERVTARLQALDRESDRPLPFNTPPDSPEARRQLTQRDRIMRAAALVATSRGYAALSIPAITATAGVSNQTFYEHFNSKQAAFLAAFEAMERRILLVALRAFQSQDRWVDGIRASLEVLAHNVATSPVHARVAFFELQAAGPAALDRGDTAMDGYTLFLRPEHVEGRTPKVPDPLVADAIGGGIWYIIQTEISAGRADAVPQLVAELTDIVVVPYGLDESDADPDL